MANLVRYQSPKVTFQQIKDAASVHREMLQNPAFERAIHFALLQYNHELTERTKVDVNTSMALHHMSVGATEFVKTLFSLAESYTPPPRVTDEQNLR